ncbi:MULTISPECIES: HD-GYP domain-containing protein [Brevibacillus]|jgi:putative nucleotidyltransferase with HDIG domain|uniref:HD-GYP domain-containing protein n=1 Tax=Brevibacillus TaxID=55080 RepID=UPI0003F63722|nr:MULTISPECIES: HD-GYP domain-containing protein [Brevibacillus]TRY24532.1 HD-GYP domain-containing protein [Brevibacillus sp. LEMMJ03]
MRQRAEKRYILKGLLVILGFTVSGILIILNSLPYWEPRENWEILISYVLLTIISSFAPVRTLNYILTLNNAVIFSGILLFGAWVGIWSAVIEALILSVLVKPNPLKAAANFGQILLTIWAVDVLKTACNVLPVPTMITDVILVVAYWFINIMLCGLGISYFHKSKWIPTVKNLANGTTLTYLLLLILGGVSARLVETFGLSAIVPMMVAFVLMSFVFYQYYDSLTKLRQKMDEIKSFNHKFLTAMAASIDARDHYTSGHSQRVAHWGREIARAIGLPEEKAEEVYFGGILHDIGKIGIEDQILNKRGKLTPEEYDKIKQHTVIGYEIILQAGMFHELLPAIRSHHERIDGKGYPDGLVGEEIPLMARILAISDAFDAMVADRPYRKGLPVEEALQEISRGAGTQFDAELAYHFIRIIRQLPRDELETIIRQDAQPQRHLQEVAR